MIRFVKNKIRLSHLLAAVLLVSMLVPLFGSSIVPEAEAAMVTNIDSTVPYYKTSYEGYQASTNKGGIIWVGADLSYGTNGGSGNTLAKYKSNPTAANLAAIRMRFYTLSEAFWFIHSGADNSDYVEAFRAADWVIIVVGKQVFNYNSDYSASASGTVTSNNNKEIPAARLQACYNYVYKSTRVDVDDLGNVVSAEGVCGTYNINGSYSFSSEAYTCTSSSYSSTGSWREYETSAKNLTYRHTGTWYITGGYGLTPTSTTSTNCPRYNGKGSQIHSALESTLFFTTGGPTHYSHIQFTVNTGNFILYGDEELIIGDGVTTPNYNYNSTTNTSGNKYTCSIYAGAADQARTGMSQAASVSSSKIVVSSGNWRTIMAGGDRGDITGNSTLRITGTAQVYSNVTLGFNMAVGGSMNFYLDGSAKIAYLYTNPRTLGSTGGATNIHLIGGAIYIWSDVGLTNTTTMGGGVNAYIYEGTKIFNMNPDWVDTDLAFSGSRNLYLVGDQSFVTSDKYTCSLSGFDNIYIQNNSTINYTSTFKTSANLTVASGSKLYLSKYSSDSDLDSKIGTLSKSGNIYYTLLMYVNGSYTLPTYTFTVIPIGSGSDGSYSTVTFVQDGCSKETTWKTLAQAYTAAAGAKVDCTFIVWGNTTQETALTGSSYNSITNSVTITADNDAVLTIPAASGFGNVTILEDIDIVLNASDNTPTASLYSGRKLTVKEGTTVTTSTGVGWQINSGWYEAACNYSVLIELYTTNPQGLSLGNPYYATGGNITAKIFGDANVGKVFFGRGTGSNGTYTSTLTVNSANAKVNSIYATPRSDDDSEVTLTGDVVINLYNGSFVERTYDGSELASGVKCIDTNGYLNGDVTINITDEFVYTNKTIFFKSTQNPDTLINGTVTMNLAGWEGDEEFTQVDWLTYVDKLGAVSTTKYNTNVICREVLPTRIISNAADTSTYAVNIDAQTDNAMYFHNDAYDYLMLTGTTSPATSGGTLVYGHDLSAITSAVTATSTKVGNIQYCSCSVCNKYFADVANANAETQISDHNGDDVINIDDVYRYWYQVNLLTVTDDGGAGGTVSVTSVGADERNAMSAVTATSSTYYSHSGWFTNEACSSSASSLGTINSTTFTPTTANVKSASGSLTGGSVTVYSYFTRNLGDLTIDRNAAQDETQVFVYRIEYDMANKGTETAGPTIYVTVVGNGAVTVNDLPEGKYIITQENDWSWRYNNRAEEPQNCTVVGNDNTVVFETVNYATSWLDANSGITTR